MSEGRVDRESEQSLGKKVVIKVEEEESPNKGCLTKKKKRVDRGGRTTKRKFNRINRGSMEQRSIRKKE